MLALQASARAGMNTPAVKPPFPEGLNLEACRQVLKAAHPDGTLELPEALHLLGAAGVPVAPFVVVADAEEAMAAADNLGYPVVLKAVGGKVSHKTEHGGVVLNLADGAAAKLAAQDMQKRLSINRMLVMKQVAEGVEIIVGAKQDPAFGALVLCGLGGVLAEVLQDVSLRLAPLDAAQAGAMLDSLKGKALLEGFRGAPKVDQTALIDTINRVAALAASLPEILELDLNPIMAGPEGVIAVDARARVKP